MVISTEDLTREAEQILADNPDGLTGDVAERFEEIERLIDRNAQIEKIRVASMDPRNVINSVTRDGDDTRSDSDPWRVLRGADTAPASSPDIRSRALSAVEQVRDLNDDARQAATTHIEADDTGLVARWSLVASDPAYMRAFGKLLRDPTNGHRQFDSDELEAFRRAESLNRAMAVGTDSAGGFLVPFTLDSSIVLTNAGVVDPIREIAQIETTATDQWAGITSAGVTAEWHVEAAEVADASPTFAQPPIPVHAGDAFVAASFEAVADTDITRQIGRLMADAKARLEGTAFTTGTGSGQPKGIITALDGGASEVAPATVETFVAADVYTTIEALPARHRPNARWLLGLPTQNTISRFFNPSGSEPPLIEGDRLLKKPYHESSSMRDTGDINVTATADNHILLTGDFAEYRIVDRVGSTLEFIPNLFSTSNGRPTGQRGWLFHWRVGADVTHIDAFRVLNVATTA